MLLDIRAHTPGVFCRAPAVGCAAAHCLFLPRLAHRAPRIHAAFAEHGASRRLVMRIRQFGITASAML